MTKGALTREAILDHAVEVAGRVGLSGLTIGSLAQRAEMSKSGLFAHFRAKESLQVQVLAHARELFIDQVIRPALSTPRGEPRIRALFEHWLACVRDSAAGCLFVSAAGEFDDRPGAVREELVRGHLDLLDVITTVARTAIAEGHFRADVDPEQFAHDLHSTMLGYVHAARLLRSAAAEDRTRHAFEVLLDAARPTPRS